MSRAPATPTEHESDEATAPELAEQVKRLDERQWRLEHELAVQQQRIADLQVQLDRAIADPPITRRT